MNGMKKIASSHAMPAVGRRLRGTTMTAMTRMTRSMTTIAASDERSAPASVVMSIVMPVGVFAAELGPLLSLDAGVGLALVAVGADDRAHHEPEDEADEHGRRERPDRIQPRNRS